jgi:hypothetical protein
MSADCMSSAGNASPLVHNGVDVPTPKSRPWWLTRGSIPLCPGQLPLLPIILSLELTDKQARDSQKRHCTRRGIASSVRHQKLKRCRPMRSHQRLGDHRPEYHLLKPSLVCHVQSGGDRTGPCWTSSSESSRLVASHRLLSAAQQLQPSEQSACCEIYVVGEQLQITARSASVAGAIMIAIMLCPCCSLQPLP